MPMNMDYCMFTNTLKALRECHDALSEKGVRKLSEPEQKAAIALVKLCQIVGEDFADIEDELDD